MTSTYVGTLRAADGSTLDIDVTYSPPIAAPPPVAVLIGTQWHVLDAVNPSPSRNAFPGGRGPNELIWYTRPLTLTVTNKYGLEVAVAADGTFARLPAVGPTGVPLGGGVLSGHGTAATWLAANATTGAVASLLTTLPSPPPPSTAPPSTGVRIEEWQMEWAGYGPDVSLLPATTNVLNLAFLQGAGIPVGWGNETQSQLVTGLYGLKARPGGCHILAGVGGSGGAVDTSNHGTFVDDVLAYRDQLGGHLDGLCWDIEAQTLNADDVVAITGLLVSDVPGWETTLAPNGGNVDVYLPLAVRLEAKGWLNGYGQQFYDAAVSLAAAEGRISDAIAAGIPVEKITVGMMIQPDSQHWTLQQCIDNMAAIKAKWPTIGGAYLWEDGRAQSAEWSAAMAKLLT